MVIRSQSRGATVFYLSIWFVIVLFLSLWSLAVWALYGAAVWSVSSAGALSGAVPGVVDGLHLPAWLAPWTPPEIAQSVTALLSDLAPWVSSLLQAAPSLTGGLTVSSWVLWGTGTALLVLLGAGLHLAIAMWRRGGHPVARYRRLKAGG